MTEKEFHKLRRRDLLQLLVAQGKENLQIQAELDETSSQLAQLQEGYERLKAKLDEKDASFGEVNDRLKARLDEKDALIEKLKGRLDAKDARIHELREQMEEWLASRRIELEDAGSIAEAALRLNGIFEVAQQAAEQYLYNIRVNRKLEKSDLSQEMRLEPEPEEEDLSLDPAWPGAEPEPEDPRPDTQDDGPEPDGSPGAGGEDPGEDAEDIGASGPDDDMEGKA